MYNFNLAICLNSYYIACCINLCINFIFILLFFYSHFLYFSLCFIYLTNHLQYRLFELLLKNMYFIVAYLFHLNLVLELNSISVFLQIIFEFFPLLTFFNTFFMLLQVAEIAFFVARGFVLY